MNINLVNSQPILNVADMSQWKNELHAQVLPQDVPPSNAESVSQETPVSPAEPSLSSAVSGKIDFMA